MPVDNNRIPRNDLLVIGVGNTLREDDGVGMVLAGRLKSRFPSLACMEVFAPDLLLAERMAEYDHVLILDAMPMEEDGEPFRIIPLEPARSVVPAVGFVTHVFDWGAVLAMAGQLFGKIPKTELLAISAGQFGFCETLSPGCAANAEKAFAFLMDYCTVGNVGRVSEA